MVTLLCQNIKANLLIRCLSNASYLLFLFSKQPYRLLFIYNKCVFVLGFMHFLKYEIFSAYRLSINGTFVKNMNPTYFPNSIHIFNCVFF